MARSRPSSGACCTIRYASGRSSSAGTDCVMLATRIATTSLAVTIVKTITAIIIGRIRSTRSSGGTPKLERIERAEVGEETDLTMATAIGRSRLGQEVAGQSNTPSRRDAGKLQNQPTMPLGGATGKPLSPMTQRHG